MTWYLSCRCVRLASLYGMFAGLAKQIGINIFINETWNKSFHLIKPPTLLGTSQIGLVSPKIGDDWRKRPICRYLLHLPVTEVRFGRQSVLGKTFHKNLFNMNPHTEVKGKKCSMCSSKCHKHFKSTFSKHWWSQLCSIRPIFMENNFCYLWGLNQDTLHCRSEQKFNPPQFKWTFKIE